MSFSHLEKKLFFFKYDIVNDAITCSPRSSEDYDFSAVITQIVDKKPKKPDSINKLVSDMLEHMVSKGEMPAEFWGRAKELLK